MNATQEEPDKLRIRVRVNKIEAAASQLDSAIFLWFNNGDPISVHTLVVAAEDCFAALLRLRGRTSTVMRDWLSAQPQAVQKELCDTKNFFKHGAKNTKREVLLSPFYTEMLMFDCVVQCGWIYPHTPLMRAYSVWFGSDHLAILKRELHGYIAEGINAKEFTGLNRSEFLDKILPILSRGWRAPIFRDGSFQLP